MTTFLPNNPLPETNETQEWKKYLKTKPPQREYKFLTRQAPIKRSARPAKPKSKSYSLESLFSSSPEEKEKRRKSKEKEEKEEKKKEKRIVSSKEGIKFITCGKLETILDYLTLKNTFDSEFFDNFLLVYKLVLDFETLFNSLVSYYYGFSSNKETNVDFNILCVKDAKLRFFRIIQRWILMQPSDFGSNLQFVEGVVKPFLEKELIKINLKGTQSLLIQIEKQILNSNLDNKEINYLYDKLPTPILPKDLTKLSIFKIDPKELARQITLIEHKFFSIINENEFYYVNKKEKEESIYTQNTTSNNNNYNQKNAFMNNSHFLKIFQFEKQLDTKKKNNLFDNLKKSKQNFIKLKNWCIRQILHSSRKFKTYDNQNINKNKTILNNKEERIEIIEKLILCANYCLKYNNFNSLFAIINAIQSQSIIRLIDTWGLLNPNIKKILQKLVQITNPKNYYQNYKKKFKNCTSPSIPFIDLIIYDISVIDYFNPTFLDSDNTRLKKSIINIEKLNKLAKIFQKIRSLQKFKYKFIPINQIIHWISNDNEDCNNGDKNNNLNINNNYNNNLNKNNLNYNKNNHEQYFLNQSKKLENNLNNNLVEEINHLLLNNLFMDKTFNWDSNYQSKKNLINCWTPRLSLPIKESNLILINFEKQEKKLFKKLINKIDNNNDNISALDFGPLEKFLEYICLNSNESNIKNIHFLLSTYPIYSNSNELLNSLEKIYSTDYHRNLNQNKDKINIYKNTVAKTTKLNIVKILKIWIQNYYYYFINNVSLIKELKNFLNNIISKDNEMKKFAVLLSQILQIMGNRGESINNHIQNFIIENEKLKDKEIKNVKDSNDKHVMGKEHKGVGGKEKEKEKEREKKKEKEKEKEGVKGMDKIVKVPKPVIPEKNFQNLIFSQIDNDEFVRQITLIEFQLFEKIKPIEFHEQKWLMNSQKNQCNNLLKFINHFNSFINWLVSKIISQKEIQKRVALISKLIKIAGKCLQINNFNTLIEITTALTHPAIYRLRQTWDKIPKDLSQTWKNVSKLSKKSNNYKELKQKLKLSKNSPIPVLPYLGMFLSDLISIDKSHPNFISYSNMNNNNNNNKNVNFIKMKKISKIILQIKKFQKHKYYFLSVNEIQNFILNDFTELIQYETLYQTSLQLEQDLKN
ncbi:guanine nucleotide exchange factor [Anaeramoeba flamelloides]|uniref:Guanine nucleotide exchange factor n=1 Tax=Anaeramoeba flamelloides TaxID=1746091 RepID=A0AAV7ZGY3_9EUKA|nr:guanine nucleotide exchange factor [Anaeramoeba flamelloides]